ncbi:sugar ABC transporter ATP-binding protein [Nocardioides sp. YIM 152315]|uniref:sugar ABC transporter ATP-binding protein n=1 Tax=Nocardioides sp. YIM 152315 TaxID=3031760 RepID=UPI0023D9C651|nr:sugar ABC transporter ATP-binding protein [Nocardioides sp. YIM 152315]MDF1605846.1 sugar ABC transporter ATP-binding protein [Nocardioides sp. YIM 152315]
MTDRSYGLHDVSHSYGATRVLNDVSITLRSGKVCGLIGQNGAGKSTIVKLLSGAISPTVGSVQVDGVNATLRSPADAKSHGVLTIHQESQLFQDLDVATNIFGVAQQRLPKRFGLIDRHRIRSHATDLLNSLGVDVEVDRPVSTLPLAEQRLVELAAAMATRPAFLLLDEVTASLESAASRVVLDFARRLAAQGTGIAIISHRLAEVQEYCDEVTVVREGALVGSLTKPISQVEMVDLMLGPQGLAEHDLRKTANPDVQSNEVMLDVQTLELPLLGKTINFGLHRCEILGMTGVLGSGATDAVRVIGGALAGDCVATLNGKPFRTGTPLLAKRSGVAFLSGDRRREGIAPDMSIADNMALSSLQKLGRFGRVSRSAVRKLCDSYKVTLSIRMGAPADRITTLSGGNQQKVLIARVLASGPSIIAVDEPTQGVDIGARMQIHLLLREFADRGGAVLVFSSDPEELTNLCDRVLVLEDGEVVDSLTGPELTPNKIALAGVSQAQQPPNFLALDVAGAHNSQGGRP